MIILFSPKDIADYSIADTEYWRETDNRLLLKTSYEYNDKEDIQKFPRTIGEWKSFDYKFPEYVYDDLNADIMLSRGYSNGKGNMIWVNIINSKVGESFHKQNICVEGSGWKVDNETIEEFTIADYPNPFTKLYANRLDISKGKKRQVMLYWFMFKKFGSEDEVTLIRLSSSVQNNITDTFNSMKIFLEDNLFAAMYERAKPENISVAEYILENYGNIGMAVIALGFMIPIAIIFVGIRRKE